jgi:hypothetical protein
MRGSQGRRQEPDQSRRIQNTTVLSTVNQAQPIENSYSARGPNATTTPHKKATELPASRQPVVQELQAVYGIVGSQSDSVPHQRALGPSRSPMNEPTVNHTPSGGSTVVASITPTDSTQMRGESISSERDSGYSRKRGAANSSWRQTKQKQQKSQQRAFVTRRDNPFASFQHDPNDAESFLEGLTSAPNPKSSIIPEDELEALERRALPRGPHMSQPRGIQQRRNNQRRRRHFSAHQTVSNQELLRIKAAEQQSYAPDPSQMVFSPMRQSPHTFAMAAPQRSGHTQPYAMGSHYDGGPVASYAIRTNPEGYFSDHQTPEYRYPLYSGAGPTGQVLHPHSVVTQAQPHPFLSGLSDYPSQFELGTGRQESWQERHIDYNAAAWDAEQAADSLNWCPQYDELSQAAHTNQPEYGVARSQGVSEGAAGAMVGQLVRAGNQPYASPSDIARDRGEKFFDEAFF